MSHDPSRARGVHARKRRALALELRRLGDLVVAFSGGVDSTVLLHAAHAALGERAVGFVADSPSLPRRELAEARAAAASIGARLVVLGTDELERPGYLANDGLRCYHCKAALFELMHAWARAEGFRHLAFGEIVDDLSDDRPGALAAREGGVRAPLRRAGFTKADVRRYARDHGLAAADKPASACLASRLPRGTRVTAARLARVEAAEESLRELGFSVLRVRDHGRRARVELGRDELARGELERRELGRRLAEQGFSELELAAYVSAGRSAASPPGAPGPGS